GRRRSSSHRRFERTASAVAFCTTTASRTTRATRWQSHDPRSPPAPRLPAARAAVAAGGVAVTRVRATGIRASTSGTIEALRVTDLTTDTDMEVATSSVVDAPGVWAAGP